MSDRVHMNNSTFISNSHVTGSFNKNGGAERELRHVLPAIQDLVERSGNMAAARQLGALEQQVGAEAPDMVKLKQTWDALVGALPPAYRGAEAVDKASRLLDVR